MFHFSNAKVNTCCNSSVPCTEADSCCSRSQENTVLALIMDAIIMASIIICALVLVLLVLAASAHTPLARITA